MKLHRALSSGTTYTNTPESDAQREVWHDVGVMFDDGTPSKTIRVLAEDPLDAIERVNRYSSDFVKLATDVTNDPKKGPLAK